MNAPKANVLFSIWQPTFKKIAQKNSTIFLIIATSFTIDLHNKIQLA